MCPGGIQSTCRTSCVAFRQSTTPKRLLLQCTKPMAPGQTIGPVGLLLLVGVLAQLTANNCMDFQAILQPFRELQLFIQRNSPLKGPGRSRYRLKSKAIPVRIAHHPNLAPLILPQCGRVIVRKWKLSHCIVPLQKWQGHEFTKSPNSDLPVPADIEGQCDLKLLDLHTQVLSTVYRLPSYDSKTY